MKTYLRTFTIALLGMFIVMGMFSYVLDPYAVFGVESVSGLNERKTAAADKGRMIKSYQVIQQQPQVLLVGNSRIEIGLPKTHQFYRGPVFNLGLPGASVMMQYDYAWHAIKSTKSVREIVIAIDFVDFLSVGSSEKPPVNGSWQTRLHYTLSTDSVSVTRSDVQLKEQLSFLLSKSAIEDTFLTLVQQRWEVNALDATGFNDGLLYHHVVRAEGFAALYQQKQHELNTRLANPKLRLDTQSNEFRVFSLFLQRLANEGLEVSLFINPYHYPYLDVIANNGLGDEFKKWKEWVADIAIHFQIPLYDFSIQSPLVMQPLVTPSRNIDDNQWFWEPAHYRRAFGTLILDVLTQKNCLISVEGRKILICEQLSVAPSQ